MVCLLAVTIGTREAAAQFPLGASVQSLEVNAAKKALAALLDSQLPIKLDATSALPTVANLPGASFSQKPVQLSAELAQSPLAPGDYTAFVVAYCTEYSAHLPGNGLAYKLAPLQGAAANPVASLLWRGTAQKIPADRLQAVAWGIQSGLTLGSMPKSYQALIKRLIPEYEAKLSGDFVQRVKDSYQSSAQKVHLPALDSLLGKMGTSGQLMLSAERQRTALLQQNTSDQMRTQTLFAGQESGVTAPVNADQGPWTVRVPGVAFMRFIIRGGNMHSDNLMQLRILPQSGRGQPSPTLLELMAGQTSAGAGETGLIGYSQGAPAQALIPVLPSGQGGRWRNPNDDFGGTASAATSEPSFAASATMAAGAAGRSTPPGRPRRLSK